MKSDIARPNPIILFFNWKKLIYYMLILEEILLMFSKPIKELNIKDIEDLVVQRKKDENNYLEYKQSKDMG